MTSGAFCPSEAIRPDSDPVIAAKAPCFTGFVVWHGLCEVVVVRQLTRCELALESQKRRAV